MNQETKKKKNVIVFLTPFSLLTNISNVWLTKFLYLS